MGVFSDITQKMFARCSFSHSQAFARECGFGSSFPRDDKPDLGKQRKSIESGPNADKIKIKLKSYTTISHPEASVLATVSF